MANLNDIRNDFFDCQCKIKIRTKKGFIEVFDQYGKIWRPIYPNFRFYPSENKDAIKFIGLDNQSFEWHKGCELEIDGQKYYKYFDIYEALTFLFENFNMGGGGFGVYKSGSFQSFFWSQGTTTNTGTLANTIFAFLHYVDSNVKLKSSSISIVSTSAGNLLTGIYAIDENYNATLIAETDPTSPFDTSIFGTQNQPFKNNVILTPGIYGIAYLTNANINIRGAIGCQKPFGSNGNIDPILHYSRLQLAQPYSSGFLSTIAGTNIVKGNNCPAIFHEVT